MKECKPDCATWLPGAGPGVKCTCGADDDNKAAAMVAAVKPLAVAGAELFAAGKHYTTMDEVNAVKPARAKANRMTAAQRDKLAAWMRFRDAQWIADAQPHAIAIAASGELDIPITATNAEFVRRELLGIRKPAKVKARVLDEISPFATNIRALQIRVGELEKENKLLRADVRTLVKWARAGNISQEQDAELREIMDRENK